MIATGKTLEEAREFIRISLGKDTTFEHIDAVVYALKEMIEEWSRGSD
jgi:cysteine desulfurase